MSTRIPLSTVASVLAFASVAAAAAETTEPQQGSTFASLADWGYILRGALFIFASALAMVWIGRKISRRQK